MAGTGEVHWGEGLYLLPHHFQSMQRDFVERLNGAQRLIWGYHFGMIESQINIDALENCIVRFDRLHLIMPSGLELDFPGNVVIDPLDISEAYKSGNGTFVVSIGVPNWHGDRGNARPATADVNTDKSLYRVMEIQRPDENTGENPRPIQIRQINARLLLDKHDRTDMEILPVLSVGHATGVEVGLPIQEKNFIPPCLIVNGSARLRDLIRDLADQVSASRTELVLQMKKAGFTITGVQGPQFEQIQRLRILNRFTARLGGMVRAPSVSPFAMYLELHELLAELAALHPENDQFDAPNYDHRTPAVAFLDLVWKIRELLRGVVKGTVLSVPFVPTKDPQNRPLLKAALQPEHITGPNGYFIGITSKQDPKTLAALLEDENRFKIVPTSLAYRALFGMKLEYEPLPPSGLPPRVGRHYFRIERESNGTAWSNILKEKTLLLHWPGMESSDLQELVLYMTVPN